MFQPHDPTPLDTSNYTLKKDEGKYFYITRKFDTTSPFTNMELTVKNRYFKGVG